MIKYAQSTLDNPLDLSRLRGVKNNMRIFNIYIIYI